MRPRLFPVVLTIALVLPGVAAAQMSDQRLGERVAEIVRNYPNFTIFDDVDIAVDNRAVVLTGRVTTPIKRKEIGDRVEKIDGVRSVTNDIGVLPLSQSDQRMRVRVANAIYNHPAFWRYAQMINPPIHIIVENSRITLTGVVESEVDKTLAFSLSQVSGNFGVTNKLRVSKR